MGAGQQSWPDAIAGQGFAEPHTKDPDGDRGMRLVACTV
jgi:hypothetical protein